MLSIIQQVTERANMTILPFEKVALENDRNVFDQLKIELTASPFHIYIYYS